MALTSDDCTCLETFRLIWLDANRKETRNTELTLRSIINYFKKFTNVQECQQYLDRLSQTSRIVMVVSGRLGREIVPSVHKLRQVISIYVYCMDKKINKLWADEFVKIRAVVTELNELVDCIRADHKIQKIVEEPLSISTFAKGNAIGDVHGKFVFFQVLIACLLRLKANPADKKELLDYCNEQYKGNNVELANIREFEKNYSPDNALWWYTRESFLYKTLNAVLRAQDIHLIFLFRQYISDIQLQLKNYQVQDLLKVYRSQIISTDELKLLQQCCDQFISINSFFSTSIKFERALSFLRMPNDAQNLEAVLFEIQADPSNVTTKPFANISSQSAFPDELEILFMHGSIFRVQNIKRDTTHEVWIIQMTLCSDTELELRQVLMHMTEKLGSGETNLRTFANMLGCMGKQVLATNYLCRLLDQLLPDDPLRGDLYEEIGQLFSQAGHLNQSMQWHQKALKFKSDHPEVHPPNIDKTTSSKNAQNNLQLTTEMLTPSPIDKAKNGIDAFCLNCKTSLNDKPFVCTNKKFYCQECFSQQSKSHCSRCHQLFKPGASILEFRGLILHDYCFTCDLCNQSIGTREYATKDRKNYCVPCYDRHLAPKCVGCRQAIKQGKYTIYKNQYWHPECFTCNNCKKPIVTEEFPSHEGRAYCQFCFDQLFAEKCFACRKPISGPNGRRYIVAESQSWHEECFRCQRCRALLAGRGYRRKGSAILCVNCG